MQGDLMPNEVFELLEGMGEPVTRDSLERMGISYDFEKKTFFISLSYRSRSRKLRRDVRTVGKSSMSKRRRKE